MRTNLAVFFLAIGLFPADDAAGQARIIGGGVAPEGAYPWMAALVEKDRAPARGQFCGGMLVAPQWVLTAAHCVEGESRNAFDVWIGLRDLRVTGGAVKRSVQAIFMHPGYREDRFGNLFFDAALILLDRPVTGIDPVPLAAAVSDHDVGEVVRALGWGTIHRTADIYPDILRQVDMSIVDLADAQAHYQNSLGPEHLAAGGDGSRDTCVGDSGGPLFRTISGSPVLVGIVSFGEGCADPGVEGIYTNVLHIRAWLDAIIQLTDQPPDLRFQYRNRTIRSGDRSPSRVEGTNFGRTGYGGRGRKRVFGIRNQGGGLLMVRNFHIRNRVFRVEGKTAPVVFPGASKAVRIRFSPRRRGNYKSIVRLQTNDPTNPLFLFRVRGKGR